MQSTAARLAGTAGALADSAQLDAQPRACQANLSELWVVSQFEVQALHCHCEAPLGAVAIQGGKTTLHGLGPPRFAWDAEAGASTFQTGTLPYRRIPGAPVPGCIMGVPAYPSPAHP